MDRRNSIIQITTAQPNTYADCLWFGHNEDGYRIAYTTTEHVLCFALIEGNRTKKVEPLIIVDGYLNLPSAYDRIFVKSEPIVESELGVLKSTLDLDDTTAWE